MQGRPSAKNVMQTLLRCRSTSAFSGSWPPSKTFGRNVSTLDSESVSHFTRLASQWWDPQGEFALLHAMNPVRLQFMREKLREVGEWEETRQSLLAKQQGQKELTLPVRSWEQGGAWLKGRKILDVGCGGGLLCESLARLGADVLGIDASSTNVEMANIHASQDDRLRKCQENSSLRYRGVLAEDLLQEGEGKEQFDIVCAMEVVEHVNEPLHFLNTLADLVKPGGHLFMSTIARTPLSYFLTILMAEDVLRLVTRGTHKHEQYVNPSELIRHFEHQRRWITPSTQSAHWPQRMQFETRGTFYVPGAGRWTLASREANEWLSQSANYFFWVRKPAA